MTRLQKLVRTVLLTLVVIAVGTPCKAQSMSKGEISGGWQLAHAEEETIYAGWFADVVANMNDMLGIVGEGSGAYKNEEETRVVSGIRVTASGDFSVHTFMGGIRLSARQNPKIVPFGQVLVGGVRSKATLEGSTTVSGRTVTVNESFSSTDFGLAAGGGVNLMFTDRLGARIGANYLRVFSEDEGTNVFRFGAGVVIPF